MADISTFSNQPAQFKLPNSGKNSSATYTPNSFSQIPKQEFKRNRRFPLNKKRVFQLFFPLLILSILGIGLLLANFLSNLNQDIRQQASGSLYPKTGDRCETNDQCPDNNVCATTPYGRFCVLEENVQGGGCGNGICDTGESYSSCRVDCPQLISNSCNTGGDCEEVQSNCSIKGEKICNFSEQGNYVYECTGITSGALIYKELAPREACGQENKLPGDTCLTSKDCKDGLACSGGSCKGLSETVSRPLCQEKLSDFYANQVARCVGENGTWDDNSCSCQLPEESVTEEKSEPKIITTKPEPKPVIIPEDSLPATTPTPIPVQVSINSDTGTTTTTVTINSNACDTPTATDCRYSTDLGVYLEYLCTNNTNPSINSALTWQSTGNFCGSDATDQNSTANTDTEPEETTPCAIGTQVCLATDSGYFIHQCFPNPETQINDLVPTQVECDVESFTVESTNSQNSFQQFDNAVLDPLRNNPVSQGAGWLIAQGLHYSTAVLTGSRQDAVDYWGDVYSGDTNTFNRAFYACQNGLGFVDPVTGQTRNCLGNATVTGGITGSAAVGTVALAQGGTYVAGQGLRTASPYIARGVGYITTGGTTLYQSVNQAYNSTSLPGYVRGVAESAQIIGMSASGVPLSVSQNAVITTNFNSQAVGVVTVATFAEASSQYAIPIFNYVDDVIRFTSIYGDDVARGVQGVDFSLNTCNAAVALSENNYNEAITSGSQALSANGEINPLGVVFEDNNCIPN